MMTFSIISPKANSLNEEHSQLIIILDMIEDSRKGIDSFVQKIERFANYTITPHDRLIIEQLIDHIEIHEVENSEISVRIFFSNVGLIE